MHGRVIPSAGFDDLVNKLKNSLSGWRTKLLSFAGKITPLKSVIQSYPIHLMAGCKVSKSVMDKIEKLMRSFLWEKENDKSGIRMVGWNKISKPKINGGLGLSRFRDIYVSSMQKPLFSHSAQGQMDELDTLKIQEVEFWRKSIPMNANPLIKDILKVKDIIHEVAILMIIKISNGSWALRETSQQNLHSCLFKLVHFRT